MLLASEGSADMFGWFKRYDVLLSPEVQGRITLAGAPVEHVKVFRETTYDGHTLESVTTDGDGRFFFPVRTTRSSTPGKPFDEQRLRQVLVAEYQGQDYLLWYYVTARLSGEVVINEKLRSLSCDLNDEEISHHFTMVENPDFTHNISSICRW
ncbi:MAG: hypothetical protein CL583_19315 [Alteromonadaceae bacterium]|nr:hypothetical protein [Alteromonadaceae bacterium]|tara:strand:+ start:2111 stop:2569 length:459 start_codon:yes stop_codon:yes gene_type:complete